MKKLALIFAMAAIVLSGMVSCHSKDDQYMQFVGDWGLRKLTYYNIDYAGNPIPNTVMNYYLTPGDTIDGIDLVLRSNKSGVMVDRTRDTLVVVVSYNPITYDTIVCPDTVLYKNFTYSYDADAQLLYMNMEYVRTFSMSIEDFSDTAFTYVNEYDKDYVEKARLVRLTKTPTRNVRGAKQSTFIPRRPGSVMAD